MLKNISKLPATLLCCSLVAAVGCSSSHSETPRERQQAEAKKEKAADATESSPTKSASTATSENADLSEVKVTATTMPKAEETLPEVVVTAKRLPALPEINAQTAAFEKKISDEAKIAAAKTLKSEQKPIFFVMSSASPQAYTTIKANLAKIDLDSTGPSTLHTTEVQTSSGPDLRGTFLITPKSQDAFKSVVNDVQSQKVASITPVPVTSGFVRSYLTISYADGQSANEWIGDSSSSTLPADLASRDKSVTVGEFTHAFDSCGTVTVECLNDLIRQGYLKKTVQVDEPNEPKAISQIAWLNQQFSQSIQTDTENKKSFFKINLLSTKPHVITNIRIDHELWLNSSLSQDTTGLSEFYIDGAEKLVDKGTKGGLIYKAPVYLQGSAVDAKLLSKPEELVGLTSAYMAMNVSAPSAAK
jgi:hypothetical protein